MTLVNESYFTNNSFSQTDSSTNKPSFITQSDTKLVWNTNKITYYSKIGICRIMAIIKLKDLLQMCILNMVSAKKTIVTLMVIGILHYQTKI